MGTLIRGCVVLIVLSLQFGCISTIHTPCPRQQIDPNKPELGQLWSDLSALADKTMQGRRSNSLGGKRAAKYITERFSQIALRDLTDLQNQSNSNLLTSVTLGQGILPSSSDSFSSKNYAMRFTFKENSGTNIIGWLPGSKYREKYIVITAHYDHLGKSLRKTYFGADDNASGVAGLLYLANQFKEKPPEHSLIFIATDNEEAGLYGAKAFVSDPPVLLESIILNINLDMIAQGGTKKKLIVAGTKNSPNLKKILRPVLESSSACLRFGHDRRSSSLFGTNRRMSVNWLTASDHGPFQDAGIPYIYFGVEPHRYYHTTLDTVDRIKPNFYYASVESIYQALLAIDHNFDLH